MHISNVNYYLVDFNLPEEFQADVWDIINMDKYKNSSKKQQNLWKNRSRITDYKLDFTLCNNIHIREELKYVMWLKYDKVSLGRLGELYDFLKNLFKFYNNTNFSSIIDTDMADFKKFIITTLKQNLVIPNGSTYITHGTKKTRNKNNKTLTFLEAAIKTIIIYITSLDAKSEYDKDIWYAYNLPIKEKHIDHNRSMKFYDIKNPLFKKQVKEFCKNRLNSICFCSVCKYLNSIKMFLFWLEDNYPYIKYLDELERDIIEDYLFWLRVESGKTQHLINTSILDLKKFFEYGNLYKFEHFPDYSIIINNDYALKTTKGSKYFTDDELSKICFIIDKLPKNYGLMLYCLMNLGCRISELTYLEIDKLKKDNEGNYYLELEQFKTRHVYEKPISKNVAMVLKHQIEHNKKKFKDQALYVFVNEKNEPIKASTLNLNVNKIIYKYNILDRDGNPLHFHTHRFRSTMATNLFREGYNPESVCKLLGQKSLASLSYYATVTNIDVKEQLKPRIEKDNYLIQNIGNFDNIIMPNTVPLCNGFCSKPAELGVCKKANHCLECKMFVPSIAYLNVYEMQLKQIETIIELAKQNNMELILEKNLQDKKNLENIITKLKERLNDNE